MGPTEVCPTLLVLVNSSCHKKILQTGGLNTRNVFSHSVGVTGFPGGSVVKNLPDNSRDTGYMG